ncbi:MAG: tetratricopeptide repeat protein [Spirulinaceae cyanobacterium SM2_1_0]|nr:tetratricopeptide repeat protein [Spirulinaceae cyanobacterium SM2_1_0]
MTAREREVHLPALTAAEALSVRYRRETGKFVLSPAEADLLQGWASQTALGRFVARWLPCLVQYQQRRATQGDEPLTLARFFQDFDLTTIAHLRWALYYLVVYRPEPGTTGLEQWRGYLEAFEHLGAIAAWEEAGLLLTLTPASSDQPLHQQLRVGGYLPEAIALYERLLGHVEPGVEALCLAGLSAIYAQLEERPQAIAYSQRYLALPRRSARTAELIGVLQTLATNCEAIADYATALDAWQQYLVAVRTQAQSELAALPALLALGRLHHQQEEPARALDYWQQAVTLAANQQNATAQAAALLGLGRSHYALADFGAAIAALQQSLELAAAVEQFDFARAHLYLGGCYWALGDSETAIAQLQQCLEQAGSLADDLVLVLFFLGSAHYGRREYPAAVVYLEQYLQQADASRAPHTLWQRALSELGQAQYALNNSRAAIASLQRYLAAVEAAGEPQDLSLTFLTLGRAYSAEQDYAAAIEALQHYLTLLPSEPSAEALQTAYLALGQAYLAQQEFKAAIRYLDQYVVLESRQPDVYLALGQAHCGMGNWLVAIANLQTYQQLAQPAAAVAWFYLGYARHARGDWTQSQVDLQRYSQASTAQDSAWELAEAFYCLGDLAYRQHDYPRAVDYWQRFLQRQAATGGTITPPPTAEDLAANSPAWVARDPWQESSPSARLPTGDRRPTALLNLGRAYAQLGEFDRATACWQELLNLAAPPELREAALFELGGAREVLGRYDEAIAAYQQALVLADARQDAAGTGRATGRIGVVHYYRGDYDKALSLLHKYLRVTRQLRDRALEGSVLNDLGRVYAAQGDGDRALSLHQQALNLAREQEDEWGAAIALASLGAVYGDLGNYTQAVKHLQQSLPNAQKWQARLLQAEILYALGRNQTALLNYEAANEALQAALSLAQTLSARRLQALVLGELAVLQQAQGESEMAQESGARAVAIARELGLPEVNRYLALQKDLAPSALAVFMELVRSLLPKKPPSPPLDTPSSEPHHS